MSIILQTIIRSSGILTILIAWLFLVIPALKFGINVRSETITASAKKNYFLKKFVVSGLIIGALFQAIFLIFLMQKFFISFSSVGSILYLSISIATICAALTIEGKYSKIHVPAAVYYFLFCPTSLLLIGFSAQLVSQRLLLVSLMAPIIYFIGHGFLYKRYHKFNALTEFWSFIVLTAWTLIMIVI